MFALKLAWSRQCLYGYRRHLHGVISSFMDIVFLVIVTFFSYRMSINNININVHYAK